MPIKGVKKQISNVKIEQSIPNMSAQFDDIEQNGYTN